MSKIRMVTMIAVGAVAVGLAGAASAQNSYWDFSCGQLWQARNQIYKNAGYCFKTPRAISFFGNAGCQYDSMGAVPLSSGDQYEVAQIVRVERSKGCSD